MSTRIIGTFFLNIKKSGQKVPLTLESGGALVTGVTAPTIEISKNGASYVSPNDGTFTEIGNGDYTVTLDKTDTDAPGFLLLRVIDASTDETKVYCEVSIDAAEKASMAERIRVFRRREFA